MMKLTRSPFSFTMAAVLSISVLITTPTASFGSESTEHVVEITGFKFIPESISVKAGDKVTWINKDIVPHTATADNMSFDTGLLNQNESGSITFSKDQTISYFCKFHPNMKAKLIFE